jgi:prevent-host-death family protein
MTIGIEMNKHVSKSEFKARALELMREVEESGKPLLVTDRGRPVVELRKIAETALDPLEELKGSVLFYERPFDPVGEDDWDMLPDQAKP